MDDIVLQALRKWPSVPDCYGWLGLDARGQWYMRDAATQALGPFPTLQQPGSSAARGSRLLHEKLLAFVARNYEEDARGCWFFQNGPQRVYVELEAAPWIWRIQRNDAGDFEVSSHTGLRTQPQSCWLDEEGRVYLVTPLGLGLVHSQDVGCVAEALESSLWQTQSCTYAELLVRHTITLSPARLTTHL